MDNSSFVLIPTSTTATSEKVEQVLLVAEKFEEINGTSEFSKLALWEMFRGSLDDETARNSMLDRADLYHSLTEAIDALAIIKELGIEVAPSIVK